MSSDLAAGNFAGKFERLVCKSLNRLPNALELESSPGRRTPMSATAESIASHRTRDVIDDPSINDRREHASLSDDHGIY